MEEYPRGCGVVAAYTRRGGGFVLNGIEIGASIGHADLPMRQSLAFSLDLRFSLEELVLSWGRQVIFPLLLHQLLNEGLLLGRLYLLLRLLHLPYRLGLVVIHAWTWYFPMNLSIIIQVISSFGSFALLVLLILVLILERALVLSFDLVSLNAVAIDAVCATVHVANAYHTVKTNKL